MPVELEFRFNAKRKNFTASKNLSRDILQYFKEKNLLPYVLPELFPEKFDGKIIINQHDQKKQKSYLVRFLLDIEIPKEMEESAAKYKNRSIDKISDKTLKFVVEIPKKSKYVKKNTDEEIILSFY